MQQSQSSRTAKEDHENDNPALSKIIERNICTIIHLRTKAARERGLQSRIAEVITSFSGRMIFAYVHIVWFGLWILLNTGRFGVPVFDPFQSTAYEMRSIGRSLLLFAEVSKADAPRGFSTYLNADTKQLKPKRHSLSAFLE
jgi:hypothetical protein